MNKNQKILLKALETITNSVLFLEDAQNIIEKITKEEVSEVIAKFSNKIIPFDEDSLYQDSYNFQGYADSIIGGVVNKIGEN